MIKHVIRGGVVCGLLSSLILFNSEVVLAQTAVQLPTFRFFALSTTVEVPDSGSGSLGGLDSSGSGQNNSGIPGLGARPFANRAISGGGHAGGTSVTATVHDFDAMDRERLGADFADSRTPVMLRGIATIAAGSSSAGSYSAVATDSSGGQSVADLRRQQAVQDSAAQSEAAQYCEQARAAEAAGKPGVAKIYYQMAARRATGSFKVEILTELHRINAARQFTSASPNSDSGGN
jgi:hypothetical protein